MSNLNPEILQPGPELDALAWIAMGRKVVAEDPITHDAGPWLELVDHWTMINGKAYSVLEQMPEVSTDPTAMMECWNWLDEQGYRVSASTMPEGYRFINLSDLDLPEVDAKTAVVAYQMQALERLCRYGDTPAHALALMVVKVGAVLKELEARWISPPSIST